MRQLWNNIVAFFRHPATLRWGKRLLITISILLLLGLIAWFAFRGRILEMAWEKASNSMKVKGYALQCKDKRFSGIFTIHFDGITLVYSKNDTLASVQQLEAGIAVIRSIFNGPTLGSLSIDNTRINLIKTADYCNFCALSSKKTKKVNKDPLFQRLFDLLKRSVAKIPSEFSLRDFRLSFRDTSDTLGIQIPAITYNRIDIDGQLLFLENGRQTGFALNGELHRSSLTGKLSLKPVSGKWAELPVLKRKFNISAGFEAADFELEALDMDDGVLHLEAMGHFSGITADDRRLADTSVIIRDCSGKLVANIAKDFIEIDSSTSLSLNKIKTNLYASAKLGADKSYTLKFKANRIRANDFFASLPEGMFRNLKGIEGSGELEYRLFMHLDDKEPQKVQFESELTPYDFKITKMGETDLRKMNGAFVHTFYDHGKPVRSFAVGSSNPSFTPLEAIPETVQKAVMTGEDPLFYSHNGFYQEAIRQSIAQNYVQKRFARGGSTISMQLVKNVFLSRRKTLARKAEEILIVWLIESQRLTSKARMFEVYLNIIEWGPGVFGIGEAAPFYFGKGPSELSPLECAFLASIVPMPKSFAYFIDSAGYVSDRDWNFVAIRNNMIKNGSIDAADSSSFNVQITGPAQRFLIRRKPQDSTDLEVLPELGN